MAIAYRICTFPDCGKKHFAKGHCGGHYRQYKAGETLRALRNRRSKLNVGREDPCAIRGCSDPRDSRTLCHRHYQQAYSFRIEATEFAAWWNSVPGCMICGRDESLTVDHDHSCCGNVKRTCGRCNRGLLCRKCNAAVGMMSDDPDVALKAADYMLRNLSRA